jgi:hypothetical protein
MQFWVRDILALFPDRLLGCQGKTVPIYPDPTADHALHFSYHQNSGICNKWEVVTGKKKIHACTEISLDRRNCPRAHENKTWQL